MGRGRWGENQILVEPFCGGKTPGEDAGGCTLDVPFNPGDLSGKA